MVLSKLSITSPTQKIDSSITSTRKSLPWVSRNISKTYEGGFNASPTVERNIYHQGAILNQDQNNRFFTEKSREQKRSGQESIYSSFSEGEESLDRKKFEDLASIATMDKSVQEIKKQTKLGADFLKQVNVR